MVDNHIGKNYSEEIPNIQELYFIENPEDILIIPLCHGTIPEDMIIDQSPKPFQLMDPFTRPVFKFALTVSTGPDPEKQKQEKIPDVLGISWAEAELKFPEFEFILIGTGYSGYKEGLIMSQTPGPMHTNYLEDNQIAIVLSLGPPYCDDGPESELKR